MTDSSPSAQEITTSPDRERPRPALGTYLQVAVLGLLVVAVFHQLLVWMVEQWWRDAHYGHGFLIPLISGYLVYRQIPRLRDLPVENHRWGLPLMLAGALFHLAALLYGAHFPSGFALIILLYGLVIWLQGWPRARALLFPFAFLFFMVPMARLLVDKLAMPMQLFSARGAAGLAGIFGMQTTLDGVSILTRDYAFEVAIPCSGLHSVIAMSALGALVAYALEGAAWRRWLLFVASLPVALAANLIRIWITLILGNSLGPAVAEGFFHKASGALVFLLAFLGLLLIGGALGCRQLREDI
ncbi:MAG: exosortase/archaeosortase family protein [candidate division WS1 bacterium]|jgi:exosortase|nr:exosortase/archaeosortase family protein [candidate division WS1 bacterium]